MKQKNIIIIFATIFSAFIIRTLQVFCFIEPKTGFYKSELTFWGTTTTILAVLLCVVAAIIGRITFKPTEKSTVSIFTVVTAGITACTLFYEVFAEKINIQGAQWQVIALKIIGVLTAAYFGVLAISRVVGFKIPDVLHTLPAFYMIIRIICSFINISALSLIAENIFLLAAYCSVLLFFVSYAGVCCLGENVTSSVCSKSVLALAFCISTAVPNIVANLFTSGYTHIPVNSQLVLFGMSLFLLSFIYEITFKKEKQ